MKRKLLITVLILAANLGFASAYAEDDVPYIPSMDEVNEREAESAKPFEDNKEEQGNGQLNQYTCLSEGHLERTFTVISDKLGAEACKEENEKRANDENKRSMAIYLSQLIAGVAMEAGDGGYLFVAPGNSTTWLVKCEEVALCETLLREKVSALTADDSVRILFIRPADVYGAISAESKAVHVPAAAIVYKTIR